MPFVPCIRHLNWIGKNRLLFSTLALSFQGRRRDSGEGLMAPLSLRPLSLKGRGWVTKWLEFCLFIHDDWSKI